jgi:hypothetical protein
LHFARLETIERALASGLGFVAVNAVGVDAQALQAIHQLVDANAGLGEHQNLAPALFFEQVDEQFALALLVHCHDPLLDRRRSDVARADFNAERVVEHLPGERADGVGEGRGEQ